MSKNKEQSYQEMKQELEDIVETIQQGESVTDLDELLSTYKRGEELVSQMQEFLDEAKNTIQKIKKDHS